MKTMEHLLELRRRLLWCVGSVVAGATLIWIFFNEVFGVLEQPYCAFAESTGRDCEFLITDVLEPFNVTLTVAGYGGVIVALPVIFYHFARFVMPALYSKEKRLVIPFVVTGVLLFAAGVAGGFFLMPKAIEVLLTFSDQESFVPQLRAERYLGFFIRVLFAFGLAAELPLVLTFLQKIGLLSTDTLRKNRRVAIAGIVILGAVITPTGDPFILLAVSLPMYVLFEISILIGARWSKTT